MSDLDELYQDVLLEHAKSPRRRGRPEGSCSCAEAFNPLCGDEVVFFIQLANGSVVKASHEGSGCAISQASASMAAQAIEGLSVAGARVELGAALALSKGEPGDPPLLEDWAALGGVCKFPSRVKCATLPLRAALAALNAPPGSAIELGDEK